MHNYRSVPGKHLLLGKRLYYIVLQGATVAASIQAYGIFIRGKLPCGPKSRVMFKRPWVLTQDTTVCTRTCRQPTLKVSVHSTTITMQCIGPCKVCVHVQNMHGCACTHYLFTVHVHVHVHHTCDYPHIYMHIIEHVTCCNQYRYVHENLTEPCISFVKLMNHNL